jgi:hypothetical protein
MNLIGYLVVPAPKYDATKYLIRFAALVELRLNGRRGTPRPTDKGAIMIEQLNECRAEFEKWGHENGQYMSKAEDGTYLAFRAHLQWQAWQAAWNRRAVPEGWVTVPAVPTFEMVDAGDSAAVIHCEYGEDLYIENIEDVYRAMIAAAPKPKET